MTFSEETVSMYLSLGSGRDRDGAKQNKNIKM